MARQSQYKKKKSNITWSKAQAEEKWYFLYHNLLSITLFFYFALNFRLFERQSQSLSDIVSIDFLIFIVLIFGLTFICQFMARILVYIPFKAFYKYRLRKTIKSFEEINTGINEYTSFGSIYGNFLSAVIFAIGMVFIIQAKFFRSDSLWALVSSYILIKIGVYFYVWKKYK